MGIEDSEVSGDKEVGLLAGYIDRGYVYNCYSKGFTSGEFDVAGFIGRCNRVYIANCYCDSKVYEYNNYRELVHITSTMIYNTDSTRMCNCYSKSSMAEKCYVVNNAEVTSFQNCYFDDISYECDEEDTGIESYWGKSGCPIRVSTVFITGLGKMDALMKYLNKPVSSCDACSDADFLYFQMKSKIM